MSQHTQYADMREIGADDESPWTLEALLAAFLMVLFVIGIVGFAQQADERAAAELQRLARAERQAEAIPEHVAAAYERGLVDALQMCGLQATHWEQGLQATQAVQGARR